MCLTSVDHVYAKTEDEADKLGDDGFIRYCIARRYVDYTGHDYYGPAFSYSSRISKPTIMSQEKSQAFMIENARFMDVRENNQPYPIGFHVFLSEVDARRYAEEWGFILNGLVVSLLKVMCKKCIAEGKQNIHAGIPSYSIEVYHERMIMEDIT